MPSTRFSVWVSGDGVDSGVVFQDRSHAGRLLAARLEHLRTERPVVVALPRGGVVVGAAVAAALDAPLDVLVVRKLGAPGNPEYAIGAIARDATVLNDDVVPSRDLPVGYLERVTAAERAELERRERAYRGERPPVPLQGRTAILVDDGLATGSTAAAALVALRRLQPRRVVLAVPVAAPDAVERVKSLADEMVCLAAPPLFRAVSLWYDVFDQTSDAEVMALLEQLRR